MTRHRAWNVYADAAAVRRLTAQWRESCRTAHVDLDAEYAAIMQAGAIGKPLGYCTATQYDRQPMLWAATG